jgi:hypothetical protein
VIADLDEVLRDLLIREIDIKDNEVDITFDQPKREWSARLSKPTLNLFLFDVRENLRLRGAEQYSTITRPDGNSEIRRNPVRMALRYLIDRLGKRARRRASTAVQRHDGLCCATRLSPSISFPSDCSRSRWPSRSRWLPFTRKKARLTNSLKFGVYWTMRCARASF